MNLHPLTDFFAAVIGLTWRASWLILVLLALRQFVRGRVPAGRCGSASAAAAAWLLVAIRLLTPFSFPTGWSPYNLATTLKPAPIDFPMARATIATAPLEPTHAPMMREVPPAPVAAVRVLPTSTVPVWSLTEVLATIWIIGIALLAVARLLGSWSFRRQLRDEVPMTDGRVVALIELELKQAGESGRLMVSETGAVDAPALFGLVRPRLLLPPGLLAQLTDDELRHVVCHELGHWRRRDLLAHGLMQLAVALHWFNPLAWLAARLARADCELACDEFVLRRDLPGGAPAYGATLLKVLGVVRGRRRPVDVVAMLEGREQLAQRIRMIAGYRASTLGRVIAGLVLVAMLAIASLTRESRAEARPIPAVPPSASVGPPQLSPETIPAPSTAVPPVANEAAQGAAGQDRPTEAERKARALDDLKATIELQRQRVDQLARQLQEYKKGKNEVSLDTRKDIVIDMLKALSVEELRAGRAMFEIEIRRDEVNICRAKGTPLTEIPFIANLPNVSPLIQQLSAQQITIETLRKKYREKHPILAAALTSLAQTQQELAKAIESARAQIESDYQAAQRNFQRAQDELAKKKAESIDLDRDALEYHAMERELRAQEQILQNLTARAREVTISTGSIVAPQNVATFPSSDFSISIMGEVNHQGAIGFTDQDHAIVLDVIARAGGFTPRANRGAVRIIRFHDDGSRTETVLSAELLMAGTSPELQMHRGDIIVVPEQPQAMIDRTVSISGQVRAPGVYAIGEGNMLLRDLVLKAGGLTETANGSAVRVNRANPAIRGGTQYFFVNIISALRGEMDPSDDATTWRLEPGDIVYVPERIISGGASLDQRPPISAQSGTGVAQERTITLVARDAVYVEVVRKAPDESDGELLFKGNLVGGQRQVVSKPGPLYISTSAAENLMVEFHGHSWPTGQKGFQKMQLN